ncbi:hypothetical protein KCP75_16145 [Salmonella enterica subsp. enterica]|nr:hypothetical protein KCP75_16145 [Salmonella enterica subsp. enterica]
MAFITTATAGWAHHLRACKARRELLTLIAGGKSASGAGLAKRHGAGATDAAATRWNRAVVVTAPIVVLWKETGSCGMTRDGARWRSFDFSVFIRARRKLTRPVDWT